MRLYNININLITVIQKLYEKATSAVCFNNSIGDWFKTLVGVRQGCLLSPFLFSILLERIMTDALEDHAGTVSIGGRTITNLRFADDIDGLAGTETELTNLVERLDKTSAAYGMQISAEKTKLMMNNINGISSTIKVSGEKLETVQSFKYLGAIVTGEGSRPEILSRIAQATGALANLKVIWKDKNIALSTKIRLLRSLIMSIFLYACETWTLGLAKTFLQGTVQGGRRRGRQRKQWEDNICEWTGLGLSNTVRKAEEREEWRRLVVTSCGAPTVYKIMGQIDR